MNSFRRAEAGDICVLLVPDVDERMMLRQEQETLVKAFGGWVVPEPHITLQRFRLDRSHREATAALVAERFKPLNLNNVIQSVQDKLSRLAPFPVQASGLTQFLAPFWGTYVLRWEVERDGFWNQLIQALDSSLKESDCELHYTHEIVPTCSAVDLTRQISLDDGPGFAFPRALFTARRLLFTGVLGANDFETLGMAKIGI